MEIKTFKLNGFEGKFYFMKEQFSHDGSDCITMMIIERGEESEFTTISICMDEPPKQGMWIKNYGENTEVIAALEDAGFLERTGQITRTGYVTVPAMELTPKAKEYICNTGPY